MNTSQKNKHGVRLAMTVLLPTMALALMITVYAQAGGSQAGAAPPSQPRSVWDGVYSDQQAQRGEALYRQKCASCHGDQLTGKASDNVPALTGREFMEEWDGRNVGDLYRKILRKMPEDDPGTLTPQQSIDSAAFILSFNKFPAGKAELPADKDALAAIRFEARKPQKP